MKIEFKLGNYYIIGAVISTVTIVLDQITKITALKYLGGENSEAIALTPFANFVLVWNKGISFGMFNGEGQDYSVILTLLALSLVIALTVWMLQVKEKWLAIALSLIIGGALGNVIDRLRLGAVVDFIDLYVGNYHWPAFNVADSCIAIGAFIMLLVSIVNKEVKDEIAK